MERLRPSCTACRRTRSVTRRPLTPQRPRRSDSESRSAAATTAGACMRPGWRERRSSGPLTDTAATILPLGERTGADTDATPCSRSPTDCAQPRRRMPDSAAAEKAAFCRPRWIRSGSSQASSTCAAEPARMVSCEPTGIGVAQAGRPLGGGHADAVVALAAPQLRRLAGDVAQAGEHRAGGGQQAGPRRRRRRARPVAGRARSDPAGRGPPGGGAPARPRAGGRSGRARPVAVTRPASVAGPGLERGEHEGGLVEHADAAGVVHMAILPSQIMGRKL